MTPAMVRTTRTTNGEIAAPDALWGNMALNKNGGAHFERASTTLRPG
jgi:hypothetical protein